MGTLEKKIGQMLMFGWQGESAADALTLNGHLRRLIEEMSVGGVILMGRNVGTADKTRQLISSTQALAEKAGLSRLFVSTDQEGGPVARFAPPNYPAFPSSKSIAEANRPTVAYDNAADMGKMLADVGINWALMPSLDVNNNPGNVVIGDRSFGSNPSTVARLGVESILGMQDEAGVMACGKHFPGHGDTDVDSHFALPIIRHGMARLNKVELPPFAAAIEAGVGAIMTSHILFPDVDSKLPATLSPTILTGILRNRMGYDGVIVTDCLEMKGVASQWGSAEAAVLAAIAGADVLLACHTESVQRQIRNALINAVESGRLSEARVDESNRRIERAKALWVQPKFNN